MVSYFLKENELTMNGFDNKIITDTYLRYQGKYQRLTIRNNPLKPFDVAVLVFNGFTIEGELIDYPNE